jgi:amino acid transporter
MSWLCYGANGGSAVTDVAARTAAESASGSIEQFGYRQELKRSLSLFDLTVYGLVFIGLTAPFSYFGIVFNVSSGMVPLIFAVGAVAMGFTAFSYATMSRAFPLAGSVYGYAARGIGESAGFLAGWAMLLDYVLIPAVIYVAIAIAIQAVLPELPRSISIIASVTATTIINLLGIEATARMNKLFIVLQVAFLALLLVVAVTAVANGVAGAHLSTAPLFNASEVSPNLIFGALPVVLYVYLGFDGISTLAEEARGGSSAVGRATLLALCLVGLLFVIETYLLSLFVLNQDSFAAGESTDAAVYTIAEIIGGPWFKFAVSFKVLLAIAVALASQTATARLLFGMARDGKLPGLLARVHPHRKVPAWAIVLCGAASLVTGLALANQLELLITMVSFGAMFGFLMLHFSVIVHFMWRRKSREWWRHFVAPLIGFAIIAYAFINMGTLAKIVGIAWMLVGIVALIGLKLSGRRATLPA